MNRIPATPAAIRAGALFVGDIAAIGRLRLPVIAFSVAAMQNLLIDESSVALLRHLDLPLVVVVAASLNRPQTALVTGFVFGLAVDAFHTRLFGIHALAYCVAGPVGWSLPLGGLRSRAEITTTLASVQALVATAVLVVGAWLVDGALPPGIFGRAVQVTIWVVVLVLPLTAVLGARMGLATPEPVDRLASPTSADWR